MGVNGRVKDVLKRFGHYLAHLTGWNLCRPADGGYECVGCGRFTEWKGRTQFRARRAGDA